MKEMEFYKLLLNKTHPKNKIFFIFKLEMKKCIRHYTGFNMKI